MSSGTTTAAALRPTITLFHWSDSPDVLGATGWNTLKSPTHERVRGNDMLGVCGGDGCISDVANHLVSWIGSAGAQTTSRYPLFWPEFEKISPLEKCCCDVAFPRSTQPCVTNMFRPGSQLQALVTVLACPGPTTTRLTRACGTHSQTNNCQHSLALLSVWLSKSWQSCIELHEDVCDHGPRARFFSFHCKITSFAWEWRLNFTHKMVMDWAWLVLRVCSEQSAAAAGTTPIART